MNIDGNFAQMLKANSLHQQTRMQCSATIVYGLCALACNCWWSGERLFLHANNLLSNFIAPGYLRCTTLVSRKNTVLLTCRVQHCVLTTWCGLDNCCRSFAPVCKIWSMENNDVVNLPVSLLRCGHANILCIFIVPILSDLRRDQPCLASTVIFIWTTSHLFADQSTAVMARVPVTSPTAWHPAGKAKNECMLGPSKAREIETATPGARFTLVSWHCHFRCPERAGQAHIAKGELCL